MSNKAKLFVLLTFAFSWSIVLIFKLSGLEWTGTTSLSVTLPFMFTPLLSAIIVRKGIYKEKKIFSEAVLIKPNRWFAAAWIIMPVLALATMAVSLLMPGISF
ncbi:hypothetical protein [Spirochaeta isovalerica]|uniref:Uncharacterized protein n=1 Tax=Spirochaeta isovalerica TaxID=150 RepID=A0A841R6M4_9SPIO|nr:hypothetical protein [Spirochaeta isovalerica]MBB6480854.1 hypothetical protein [Spirochaeta isovalerica]